MTRVREKERSIRPPPRLVLSEHDRPATSVTVLAARLREADQALAAASFLTVKARVASALIALGELFGEPHADHIVIRYKINQNDLAAMVGTARENVSRVLSGWKKRKVITRSSGYWRLDDIAALRLSMHS